MSALKNFIEDVRVLDRVGLAPRMIANELEVDIVDVLAALEFLSEDQVAEEFEDVPF